MDRAIAAAKTGNYEEAKRLVTEVVYGVSNGQSTDPGMAGSLLYHMAMVTKMEAETRFLMQEFPETFFHAEDLLRTFYRDFVSDAVELTHGLWPTALDSKDIIAQPLGTNEKIVLFAQLAEKTKDATNKLAKKTPTALKPWRLFTTSGQPV